MTSPIWNAVAVADGQHRRTLAWVRERLRAVPLDTIASAIHDAAQARGYKSRGSLPFTWADMKNAAASDGHNAKAFATQVATIEAEATAVRDALIAALDETETTNA